MQFAVDVLKVRHIIVCGHYGCGGVLAALRRDRLGLSDNWLRHVQDVRDKHEELLADVPDDDRAADRLCELNVIEQVANVCQTTIALDAWERGQELTVHGWIYGLQDGLLRDLNVTVTGAEEKTRFIRQPSRVWFNRRGPEWKRCWLDSNSISANSAISAVKLPATAAPLTTPRRARIVLPSMAIELTRNFCIIAHIDHGKTTLSDRLLERTGTIHDREKQDQLLDSMDLERERGITIKAHPVAMRYTAKDGQEYRLNLLDTPGHVDFAYEVSRSLAACEGALLIIDAAQGVEAQTVANVHLAHKQGLTLVPVINKIDLPNADLPAVHRQLEEILAIPAEEAIDCSAKMGIGIDEILEAVVASHSAAAQAEGRNSARARLRFGLRHLPRRGRLCARLLRQGRSRSADQGDEHRHALRGEGSRRFHPEDVRADDAAARAMSATSSRTSRRRPS